MEAQGAAGPIGGACAHHMSEGVEAWLLVLLWDIQQLFLDVLPVNARAIGVTAGC